MKTGEPEWSKSESSDKEILNIFKVVYYALHLVNSMFRNNLKINTITTQNDGKGCILRILQNLKFGQESIWLTGPEI